MGWGRGIERHSECPYPRLLAVGGRPWIASPGLLGGESLGAWPPPCGFPWGGPGVSVSVARDTLFF